MSDSERRTLIRDLAAQQRGMITTTQIDALGIVLAHATLLTRAGFLQRVRTGVYRLSETPTDPHLRVRGLWMAAELSVALPDRIRNAHLYGAVSHHSAAFLHGLLDAAPDPDQVTPGNGRIFKHSGVVRSSRAANTTLAPSDIVTIDDMAVTSLSRTLADVVLSTTMVAEGDLRMFTRAVADAGPQIADIARALAPPFARRAPGGAAGDRWLEAFYEHAGRPRAVPLIEAGWRPQLQHTRRLDIATAVLVDALTALAHPIKPEIRPAQSRAVSIAHERLMHDEGTAPTQQQILGAVDGFGQYGVLDDDGETVLCHECGRRFISVGVHLRGSGHALTAREYKIKHGLTLSTALNTRDHSRKLSTSIAAVVSPEVMDQLREQIDQKAAAARRRQSRQEYEAPATKVGARQRSNAITHNAEVWTCPACGAQWCLLTAAAARTTCSETCRIALIGSRDPNQATTGRDAAIRAAVEAGRRKRDVAREFMLPTSTVARICRDE